MASAKGQRTAAAYNAGLLQTNRTDTENVLRGYGNDALTSLGQGQNTASGTLNDNAGLALDSLGSGYGTARTDVGTGYDAAAGNINMGVGNAAQAYNSGMSGQLGSIQTGLDQSLGALGGGYTQARSDLQNGINGFDTWANNGRAASNAQNDFLGLNGADASGAQAQALSNFRGSTGYQDILDQSTNNALRKAAAIGGLGGNQADELARIGGSLANQSGQQYLTNLGGISQTGLQAAGQQQAGYTNQANLASQYGQNQANLYSGAASANSGIYGNNASQLGGLYANQGSALAGLDTARGNALAGLDTGLADRQAGVYTGLGSSLSNNAMTSGAQQAGVYTGLGNSLNQLGQYTVTGITGGVTEAGKAGDAAKQANQQTAINLGTSIFNAGTKLLGF